MGQEITAAGAPPAPKWTALDFALLLVVLVLATWLRLTHIDSVPSFDEIWHMETTQGYGSGHIGLPWNAVLRDVPSMTSLDHAAPVWAIWQDMRGVLHPPLFLIALRLWREVFGDGNYASHWFSISWSLVAIVFTFASAKLGMNRWAALLCAATLACAQTQIYFSQEIRAYAMMIALGSIALWLMTRCEVLGVTRRRIIVLALMTLPLLLTHYFTFGAAAAIGVYGIIRAGRFRRHFIAVIAACAVFYLVAWVPFAVRQMKDFDTGDVLLKVPQRDIVFTTLMLAGSPFRLLAERDYQMEITPVFSGVLFVLPWLLRKKIPAIFPWVLWLTLTMGAIAALDMVRTTRHAAYIRYLAIATPAVPLLFVGTAWAIRRWLAYVAGAGVAFVGLIYLISRNGVTIDAQPYPLIAMELTNRLAPGEPILSYETNPDAKWRAQVVLMVASHEPNLFPRTIAVLDQPMTPALIAQLPVKRAWLIARYAESATAIVPGSRVLEAILVDEDLMLTHLEIDSPSAATAPAGSIGDVTPSR